MTTIPHEHAITMTQKSTRIADLDHSLSVRGPGMASSIQSRNSEEVESSIATFYDCRSCLTLESSRISLDQLGDVSSTSSHPPRRLSLISTTTSSVVNIMDRCLSYRRLFHTQDDAGNQYTHFYLWWLETARQWRQVTLQWASHGSSQPGDWSLWTDCSLYDLLKSCIPDTTSDEDPTIVNLRQQLDLSADTVSGDPEWRLLDCSNDFLKSSVESDSKTYMAIAEELGCPR